MPIIPYYVVTPQVDDGGTPTIDPFGNPVVNYSSPVGLPLPSEVRKKWCYGLPLTSQAGIPMSDEDIFVYLEGAVAEVERRLGIFLKPMIIVCEAKSRGLVKGEDYDKEEAPYDYDARSWVNYGFLQLRERPLIDLTEFKLVLPNYQVIMDFMERTEWVKINETAAQLRIVPYAGDPSIMSMAGGTLAGYPFMTGAISGNLPQMLYVSYRAGYNVGELPKDIRNAVAKLAAIEVLGIASDAIRGGITSSSTSLDGLSESTSASPSLFGARMGVYQKDIDRLFDEKQGGIRSYERGITMTGL